MLRSRSLLTRSVSALFGLWLAFVLTQPVAVHACALRNGTLVQMVPGSTGHGAHATMAMAGHEDMSGDAGQHADHRCHCVGDCAASIFGALPSYRSAVPAPASVTRVVAITVVAEPLFEQPEHLLPFATAPPTSMNLSLV